MREIVKFLKGSEVYEEVVDLEKVGEKVRIIVAFYGRGEEKLKIKVVVNHLAPETESEIFICGVLDGKAEKEAEMRVNLERGCRGAKAMEKEEVMLLSDEVLNMSRPVMNCGEEEAHGEHGASSGKIDEEEVRYLQTRGLTETEAREVLTRAKLMQAVYKVKDKRKQGWLRQQLSDIMER